MKAATLQEIYAEVEQLPEAFDTPLVQRLGKCGPGAASLMQS